MSANDPVKKNSNQFIDWAKRHKVWTGVIAFIALCIVIGAVSPQPEKKVTTVTKTTTSTSKPAPAPSPAPKQPAVSAEYKSALVQAGTYSNTMHMSKQGVYDQLVSEYGGKFTAPAAQYAIDNVKSDWNANALAKAKTYQNTMHLSPAAIHDQLTSSAGEKFTATEADYAIAHLNS